MTTLEYQRPSQSNARKIKNVLDWAVLVIAVVMFVEADTILEAAGGMVWYYLLVASIALYPLGWGNGHVIKVISLLLILASSVLANRDNEQGLIRQERVLRVKLTAEARQATTTQTATTQGR